MRDGKQVGKYNVEGEVRSIGEGEAQLGRKTVSDRRRDEEKETGGRKEGLNKEISISDGTSVEGGEGIYSSLSICYYTFITATVLSPALTRLQYD